jgi:hypothetical protein
LKEARLASFFGYFGYQFGITWLSVVYILGATFFAMFYGLFMGLYFRKLGRVGSITR